MNYYTYLCILLKLQQEIESQVQRLTQLKSPKEAENIKAFNDQTEGRFSIL